MILIMGIKVLNIKVKSVTHEDESVKHVYGHGMNMDMEIKVLHMIMIIKESVTYENESVTFQHIHQHLDIGIEYSIVLII